MVAENQENHNLDQKHIQVEQKSKLKSEPRIILTLLNKESDSCEFICEKRRMVREGGSRKMRQETITAIHIMLPDC